MLRHMCIVDRRLEFLATLSDSPDTVEAEEAAVGSLEVAGPSGELQDRPEQQEQLIRCVVEGVMSKGDKGISVSWRFNRMEVLWLFERCWFHFYLGRGRDPVFLSPSYTPWQTVVSWILRLLQASSYSYRLIGERRTELLHNQTAYM